MKRIKQIAILLATAITASLCQPTVDTSAASIKLSKSKIKLTQGKTTTLKVKGTKKKAKWGIKSGKKYIKLQKKRKTSVKIKALKVGTARVQCKIGKKKLVCKVTVKNQKIKLQVTPQTSLQPTVAPITSPAQTPEPTKEPIRVHTPTENRLMAEPAKSTLLPAADENGLPIHYGGGRRRYYFFGTEIQRTQIEEVRIADRIQIPEDAIGTFDLSEKQNESVMAWYTDFDMDNQYEMVIAQEDGVVANPNSSYLFCEINRVTGLEHLYTTEVTNMSSMFLNYGLPDTLQREGEIYLDLGDNFDTSNVENMDDMFRGIGLWDDATIRLGKAFSVAKVTDSLGMFALPEMGYNYVLVPNETVRNWILDPSNYCAITPSEDRFVLDEK